MRATLLLLGWVLLSLCGCQELQTNSRVRLLGNVEGKVEGKVDSSVDGRIDGKVNGNIRTEVPPVVDLGPVLESPIGPRDADCKAAAEKVAVIDIDGLISNVNHTGPFSVGENPLALLKEKLDSAAVDPAVKAVVLRINTPGGGVAATDQMWHELHRFRACCKKPLVACLLDLGCGGGYYLATACHQIVALPSGVVGGFGVLLNHYDAKEGMSLISVFDSSIRAGGKIDMGSPVRPLTTEEKKILTGMAESYHERMKDVIVQSRPKVQRDSNLFDGRVMTGEQALTAGLVDSVGYLDDAVALAANLGGATSPQVVLYRRHGDAARSLYATTPNRPIHPSTLPVSIPGVERSKLPLFLYMWQIEPTLVRLNGL